MRIKRHGLRNANSRIDQALLESNTQVEPSPPLPREMDLSFVTPLSSRVQGVIEVWNQSLYGTEPNIDRKFEGGNMKLNSLPLGNVLEIRNQNLCGSESNIDCLYVRENLPSTSIFQNRITEVQDHSRCGSESNINYEEGRISEASGRTRLNVTTRVGDQNLYGPGLRIGNNYKQTDLNIRVGGQNLYDPKPSVRNNNEGNNLRSVLMPGNLLPVPSNE